MLLLPVFIGIFCLIPGPECSVLGSRNVAARDPELDDDYISRLYARYAKLLQEQKRRSEQQLGQGYDDTDQYREINLEVQESPDDTQTDTDTQNKQVNSIDGSESKTATENSEAASTTSKTTMASGDAPLPPQHHRQGDIVMPQHNFLFLVIITGCTVAGLVGVIMAGVCWYKLHKKVKAASDVDYPAYGVTGPTKERLPSPGDRKLAQSAQMYHYQHQKQQMIAMERANGEMKPDASEDESEEENEEGDYTVYECPGLAPTGEMEVRNPLFTGDAQTPVNGETTVTNGLPE